METLTKVVTKSSRSLGKTVHRSPPEAFIPHDCIAIGRPTPIRLCEADYFGAVVGERRKRRSEEERRAEVRPAAIGRASAAQSETGPEGIGAVHIELVAAVLEGAGD